MRESQTKLEKIAADSIITVDAAQALIQNTGSAAVSLFIGQRKIAHSVPVGGAITLGMAHPDVVDRTNIKIEFNGAVTKSLLITRVFITD